MARLRVGVSIGYGSREEVLEIPEENLEGLTEEERQEYFDDEHKAWLSNYLDAWWEVEE